MRGGLLGVGGASADRAASDGGASSPSVQILTPESSSVSGRGSDKGEEGEEGESRDVELVQWEEAARRRSLSSLSSASSAWSPVASPSYTAEEERAVVRQFDRRLVVFVAVLYLLSFVDRCNIGNARVAGMDADLQTDPPRDDWYAWALTAFYAAYIGSAWLALLWHRLPAHALVAALVAGWGAAAALQAVAPSYPVLLLLRALLGIGEAGFAGVPLFLARFFRRDELAWRTAVFIAAAPLATALAASLAWAILALGRAVAGPIAPWRLLFLVEGFPSVVAAVAAWRVIPDAPDRARYLSRRQKQVARLRLEGQTDVTEDGVVESGSTSSLSSSLAVLADPVAWITAAMFFLANMAYSSLPVFLPTILAAMGHDPVAAEALAAPPYLAAFVLVLATARLSDHLCVRGPLLVAHALASAAGYAVLSLGGSVLDATSLWRYLAIYPAAIGFFSVVVLLIAWNLNNQRGVARQGGAFALFQAVGQCGPLLGTRLYPDADGPLFLPGMRTMTAAMLAVALLALVLRALLRRRNRQLEIRAAKAEAALCHDDDDDDNENDGGDEDEAQGLVPGPRRRRRRSRRRKLHPSVQFRYML